ncbi:helix-turn-helix transcriptional regulator [Kribbella capetownensis]|uniref:Helix-turn-helix transcriptional regulator n=1 Tax=Kribbella capetownensis TaxID=1572659 RepID=A0A4R0IV50_9ACTN|nr:LuxR C-terminal-related transcriptional regulator [Kribbella capetownensis]TCC36680.1 helix-turn-helix transcriptional regulator [Kribbella capetownensis]
MEADKSAPLRVDAETAIILREAYHKIEALFRADHYGLYDYVRVVAGKVARVDTFFVGFLQGSSRVRYPYGHDDGQYVDPDTHNFGPNGQTAWLLKRRTTYRYAYDNGAALHAGVPIGDVGRQSQDAVTVPIFRPAKDGPDQLFGMLSMQSYEPDSYDDNAVRAFEWLGGVVERVLTREGEDREALRMLPAGDAGPNLLTSDHVMEYLTHRVASIREIATEALSESEVAVAVEGYLHRIVDATEHIQSELIEMLMDTDEGPERRFTSLTKAQQNVAVLLVDGLDNDQLAAELGISLNTVKTHLSAILRKYGMVHRAQVADDVRKYLAR